MSRQVNYHFACCFIERVNDTEQTAEKMTSRSSKINEKIENDKEIYMPFCNTITITFNSMEHAAIVKSVLEVDKELQPKKVQKVFEVDGNCLCIYIKATEWRMLRVATSSFYDMAMVAVQCIDEFG